jgi:hypothetical protein
MRSVQEKLLAWRADRGVLAAAAVLVTMLLASRASYSPMWDGRIYAECVVNAASGPFSVDALRCAGHASYAYVALASLVQRAAPGSYVLILVTNAFLFIVATIGFHRILTRAFPEQRLDRALVTACFCVQPVFIASVVQPGLDFPMLPGFIWCIVFLLERRWVWLIVTGTALAFTKETGIVLYGALLGCYAIVFVVFAPGSFRSRIEAIVRLTPLTFPAFLFALNVLYQATRPSPTLWYEFTAGHLISKLLPRLDLLLINYLTIIFVLSFAWIASAWIAVDLFVGSVRLAHRLPRRPVPGANPRVLSFLLLLTGVTVFTVTRFTTYGNARYLIVAIGLLLVPFYAALLRLGLAPPVRRTVVAVFGAALLVSNVRTVDPGSRWVYGTFPVGDRTMLAMTSITGECCGRGRDQLVYNLEFTVLGALQQDAFAAVAADDSAVLVVPDSMAWYTVGALDKRTHRSTLSRDDVQQPIVREVSELVQGSTHPPSAWFLSLPNGRAEDAMRALGGLYVIGPERRFRRGGYLLSTYPLTLRSSGP